MLILIRNITMRSMQTTLFGWIVGVHCWNWAVMRVPGRRRLIRRLVAIAGIALGFLVMGI